MRYFKLDASEAPFRRRSRRVRWVADSNVKRQHGRKAQLENIAAAKVCQRGFVLKSIDFVCRRLQTFCAQRWVRVRCSSNAFELSISDFDVFLVARMILDPMGGIVMTNDG